MSQPTLRTRQRLLKQAMEWFVQLQSEQCDDNQRQQFQLWLAKNEAHRLAYREAEKVWSNLDSLKQTSDTGIEAARRARSHPRSTVHQAFSVLLLTALLGGW